MTSVLKKIAIPGLLLVIIAATSWSLIHPQLFKVHDYVHAARVAEMARGLADGQIPVRWSANFGYGYGMPLFEFYAPLPYFVGAIFWLAGVPIELVVKLLFLIPSVLTVMAAYKLSRLWFSEAVAIAAAAAIALAPYRAVNLFVRGAVSESWGMAFFVLALLAISLLMKKNTKWWPLSIISLAGIVLSHNLTALMAIPAIALWVIVLFLSTKDHSIRDKLSVLRSLLLVGSLAIGVTAFYWLPALTEKSFTRLNEAILTGYFDYHLHFLYIRQFLKPFWGYGGSQWGPEDGISFFLGYGQLIGILLSSVVLGLTTLFSIRKKSRKTQQNIVVLFIGCALITASTLFLSLQKALPLWDSLSVLSIIQFPWRFLAIGTSLLGLAATMWLELVPTKWRWLSSGLLLSILLINAQYFQPVEYLQRSDDLFYTDSARIRQSMSDILPDYIPAVARLEIPPADLIACDGNPQCQDVEVLVDRSHEKLVRTRFGEETLVTLNTNDFPGWIVEIEGIQTAHTVTADGLLSVIVPSGEHLVGWRFSETPLRITANSITIFSLLLISVWVLRDFWKHQVR